MSLRSIVTALSFGAMVYAAAASFPEARTERLVQCCNATNECGGSDICCDASELGLPACDSNAPNYCMPICKRPDGN